MFSVQTLKRGFTLVELMVVIAVVAILSTLAFVGIRSAQASARDASREKVVNTLRAQLEQYYSDKGTYPQTTSFITLVGSTMLNLSASTLTDPGCGNGARGYVATDVSGAGDPPGANAWKPGVQGTCTYLSQPYYAFSSSVANTYTLDLYKEGGGKKTWTQP